MGKPVFLHTIEHAIIDEHAEVLEADQAIGNRMELVGLIRRARNEARAEVNGMWAERRSGILDSEQVVGIFDALSVVRTDLVDTPWNLTEEVLFKAEEKVRGLPHDENLLQQHLLRVHELYESTHQGSESA